MGGPPPKAIWPLGVILRPAMLAVLARRRWSARARGGLLSGYAQSGVPVRRRRASGGTR